MTWVTSELYSKIQSVKSIIAKGLTLVGDSTYVNSMSMTLPFKGKITPLQDTYNFYQSQLRITIKRAFWVLVHRWAILRGPLVVPLSKVPRLVSALCSLHNFYINKHLKTTGTSQVEHVVPMMDKDVLNVHQMVVASNIVDNQHKSKYNNEMVSLASLGSPESLLDGGYHFEDCPLFRKLVKTDEVTSMDVMYNTVDYKELICPKKEGNQ
jgi:hypothetical protein